MSTPKALGPHVSRLTILAMVANVSCAPLDQEPPSAPGVRTRNGSSSLASAADPEAWSEPVWLGPIVNSPARDWRPVLSTDGRELYFHSDRAGGLGGFDIWASHRDGPNCPWQAPTNLGAPI